MTRKNADRKKIPPEVRSVLETYPPKIQKCLLSVRKIIFDASDQLGKHNDLIECLKWGEISYLKPGGSTVRMGWKSDKPEQYAIYFHCQTSLIETFRTLYADQLKFEGNRAIILQLNDCIPEQALKHCIILALSYHQRKHLLLLGA